MKSKLTLDDVRRLAKGGIPAGEMGAGMDEFHKDDWEEGTPGPRWGVFVTGDRADSDYDVRLLTNDHEAAKLGAILYEGRIFDPRPVNVTGIAA